MRRPKTPEPPKSPPAAHPRKRRFSGGHPDDVKAPALTRRDGVQVSERVGEAERLRRREVVGQLLSAGMSREGIVRVMAEQFSMTESAADSLRTAVLRDWRAHYEQDQATFRAEQVERIRRLIAEQHSKPTKDIRTIVALETLFARVVGNFAPLKVQVNVDATVQSSLVAMVAGMSAEDREAMVAEQRLLEERANLGAN